MSPRSSRSQSTLPHLSIPRIRSTNVSWFFLQDDVNVLYKTTTRANGALSRLSCMVHPRNRHTGCLLHRRNVNNGGICNRESRLVTRRSVNTSVQARLHCFELIYNSAKSITSLPNFAPSKLTGCWIQTLARREILEIIHLSHKVC